jgi:hypothetical protein
MATSMLSSLSLAEAESCAFFPVEIVKILSPSSRTQGVSDSEERACAATYRVLELRMKGGVWPEVDLRRLKEEKNQCSTEPNIGRQAQIMPVLHSTMLHIDAGIGPPVVCVLEISHLNGTEDVHVASWLLDETARVVARMMLITHTLS